MPRLKLKSAQPKVKTDTKRDVGDPTLDLIRVFELRNIADMDDDELLKRVIKLQEMRLIRVTTSKKPTALDMILAQIDLEKARIALAATEKKV